MSDIPLGHAPPETVLPEPAARGGTGAGRGDVRAHAARARWPRWPPGGPRYLAAWATLSEQSEDPVTAYAFARTGYHRGLDALRAAGWRGSGYVRWRYPTNRGFLRCLEALRRRAGEIGEVDEEQRCALVPPAVGPRLGQDRPRVTGTMTGPCSVSVSRLSAGR